MPLRSMMRRPCWETRSFTKRRSLSTQMRWVWRLGRKRRRDLLFAWDTLLPVSGPLPVTWQTRDMILTSEKPADRPFESRPLCRRPPDGASHSPWSLEQAAFGEADAGGVTHHQVIQHADIDECERVPESPGDHFVGLAGLGDAGGVIMRQDQRGGILRQGALDDLARVDAGAVDGAAEQFLEKNHAVAVVQVQAAEHLVRQVPETRPEEPSHGIRGAEGRAPSYGFLEVAPGELQSRLKLGVFHRPETRQGREARQVRGQQAA